MGGAWLEQLHENLLRRGLPLVYVRRFLEEISDHIVDLTEELQGMDTDQQLQAATVQQRLGQPAAVADMAVHQFRQRTFSGRHPWLSFIIAPAPLMLLALIVYFLPVLLTLELLGDQGMSQQPLLGSVLLGVCSAAAYLPAAITALLLCHLAARGGRNWRWYVPACLIVALLAGSLMVLCRLPTTPGTGQLTVGFGVGPGTFRVLQAIAPLAICGIYALRELRRMRRQPLPPASDRFEMKAAA